MKTRVRLVEELQRLSGEQALLENVNQLLNQEVVHENEIKERVGNKGNGIDILNLDVLDVDRLFTIDAIRELAITYRLKFLPSKQFKQEIPADAVLAVKNQEKLHETSFENMFILAPRKYFNLGDCDGDPVLFTRVSENQYYLLAQWGNDMHVMRKILLWPVRSVRTMVITLLSVALLVNVLTPNSLLTTRVAEDLYMYRIIWFIQCLFIFGSLGFFFMFGFNRSSSEKEWNSKFFNP